MTDPLDPMTGHPAPDFTLPRDGGGTVALSDLKGRKVVLYFYPRDDTSGCTQEARDFTDLAEEFSAAGVIVLGVSRDSIASHERFRDKHGLALALLSDTDGAVCEGFGVWREKSIYGKTHMGIERSTFLIDGGGIIRQVWRQVRVPGHAAAVLEAAKPQ